jgi:hypothetical protein
MKEKRKGKRQREENRERKRDKREGENGRHRRRDGGGGRTLPNIAIPGHRASSNGLS